MDAFVSRRVDQIALDGEALSVKGGGLGQNKDEDDAGGQLYSYNVDFKQKSFRGSRHEISGMNIIMTFNKKRQEFVMKGLEARNFR